MEFLSSTWWSALLAIILIDLVLAGDNAIVIALAARKLPPALQRKAIWWGTVGAIIVRSSLTVVVVWLLKIPGLMLVGGLGLLWIACKLILDTGDDKEHDIQVTSFWGAMKTIVVADALMGVDNVLGVAGAAHGSFDLVVIGLLISVPIVFRHDLFIACSPQTKSGTNAEANRPGSVPDRKCPRSSMFRQSHPLYARRRSFRRSAKTLAGRCDRPSGR